MLIDFKKVLDSESFSSAIGDNKSVDLTFSTQISGPEQAELVFSSLDLKCSGFGLQIQDVS